MKKIKKELNIDFIVVTDGLYRKDKPVITGFIDEIDKLDLPYSIMADHNNKTYKSTHSALILYDSLTDMFKHVEGTQTPLVQSHLMQKILTDTHQ